MQKKKLGGVEYHRTIGNAKKEIGRGSRKSCRDQGEHTYTISIYWQCINSVNQIFPKRGKMPRLQVWGEGQLLVWVVL